MTGMWKSIRKFVGTPIGTPITKFIAVSFCLAVIFPCGLAAQSAAAGPQTGGHELQVWTGGGHSLSGGARDTGVWNLGLHYGWILSAPHGPSLLRGRFEYAAEVVPIFWVFEPHSTAYGFGLNPLGLKWNFLARGKIAPYFDITGGTLFTNRQTPMGTSRVNFTTSAAFGTHLLRSKYNWSAEIRFQHISNAGLTARNLGINTLQVRVGFGRFTGGK